MAQNNPPQGARVTITDLLFVLFLGLRLSHQIDWSWWLIFSPVLVEITLRALLATSTKS